MSSSPVISDDHALSLQSSLCNVVDHRESTLGSSTCIQSKLYSSKRGPGRPRKDIPLLKTPQKRKIVKESQIFHDRVGPSIALVPSSSESSNTGFSEEKSIPNVESPYSVEKYPGRVCCLCNLSERSVLGQGDFLKWDIDCSTCDMAPKICNRDEKQVPDESCKGPAQSVSSQLRRQKNNYRNKSSSSEGLNELDQVGRIEVTPLQMLVDGGYIYMHRMCLWWSQGISGKTLELKSNIESVVTKSLTRKCSFCGQYGASVVCKMNCTNVFHLPCAAAAGCFLLMENFIVFCRDHVKQVPIVCSDLNLACRHCSKIDEIYMMVMCATCGDHYHSTCVGLVNKPDTRAGWNCPQCSKCLICRECEGIEGRSIKCEQCQRLYHISCLRPAVSSLPKYGWKCNRCRVCTDCGSRTPGGGTSSRWHCHYTICDSCYQQRNKGFSCPICHKAYRATAHKEMVKCSLCHRFVHSLCDEDADLNVYHTKKENNPDYDYVCPQCKRSPNGEKLQALSNPTRCPWQSNALDIFTLTTHESIFKEVEYENYEKNSDDYTISDPTRMSKKKITFKDFQRSRSGKIVMQKNSMLSHFSRKRNVRAKSRQLLPPSTNVGLPGDKEISRISDDGLSTEKKMLLCSAKDTFILSQDICVMCGSVGLDKESHLIACAQCGQCYHPYCVNIKLSKVVLQRGWRCLDCTVCEGCGQRNDEARLILCDECDLSFHIYCMSPPLDTVPHGNWKCKWCAACQKCGRYAGIHSQNHSGFLECGPCASQVTCCVCNQQYNEKELIIQCRNCERWLHCECDSIKSEEEAQMYDKLEYHCTICRPKGRPLSYLLTQKTNSNGNKSPKTNSNIPLFWSKSTLGVEVNGTASAANDPSEQVEVTFWIDGICMSEKGANMIKSLSTEIKRKRKIKAAGDCQTKESGIIAAIESVVAGSNLNIVEESGDGELSKKKDGNYKDGMVWIGADNSPPQGFSISTNDEGVSILRRKRQRNLQKLGIGGFNVRNRTFKKVNEEPAITNLNSLDFKKKKKFLRKKVKSKLNEAYPTYLQEAFFGKTLLDMKSKNLTVFESDTSDGPNESRQTVCDKKQNEPGNTLKSLPNKVIKTLEKTHDKLCIETNAFGANTQENENDFKEVNYEENLAHRDDYDQKNEEILIQDVKMISLSSPVIKNHSIEESLGAPFLSEISSTTSSVSDRQVLLEHTNAIGIQTLQQEPSSKSDLQLNGKADFSTSTKKLNAQGDNPSLSEGELLQSCSPQKRTCGDVSHVIQQLQPTHQNNHRASQILNTDIVSMDLQLPQNIQSVGTSLINDKAMKLPVLQEGFTQQKSGGINDAAINVYFTPTAAEETAEAVVAGTQKTAEKMRRDEDLGDMATISAVLYANTQHPELKQIYPNWNDRCKQILKRWRSLSTEKKAPFLQHAKDNRSALRMRRSQQDQERICLNQKTLKEQEQERIWKQHQAKAKEAQTNAYTNRGMIYDVNICPEGGTIDKHHAMYNNDLIPEAPVQTFAAEEIYPVQDSTILIEQSNVLEKDNNPPENKQLRTLLLKQQGVASSWVLDPVPNRSNIFQQSYEFPSVMQQNAQKANLYQCADSRAQITISTLKNAAMLQSLENIPQESLVTENKSTLKCRREKISDNGDADMEKLDPDENVGFGDILGGLGDGNDDDLLKSLTAEIGDDFNILEYADPELDELASSQNLLNKLDFDYNDRNS